MNRATRETWARRIRQWKASGRSATEFAAEVGVQPRTLSWWAWNLGAAAKPATRRPKKSTVSASVALTKAAPQLSPLTFVELPAATQAEALEVVLPTTIRIRVRPGFDGTTFARLLDVLERR